MIDFAAWPLTGIATCTSTSMQDVYWDYAACPLTGIAMFYVGITQRTKRTS